MSRTATAILSASNLLHNVGVIRSVLLAASASRDSKPAKIIAMVKANAYGHGMRSVSKRLDGYVDMLGVASIDEALALREAGVKCQIMLAEGVFEPSEMLVASTEGFHVVFHDASQIKWLNRMALPRALNAWVKVNTGMGRLGFAPEQALVAYHDLLEGGKVRKPLRILSHFGCADELYHPLNSMQVQVFSEIISKVDTEYSLCNSAALFHFPDQHYHFVRPGLALYGVHPSAAGGVASDLDLKPVMTLQSTIIAVQHFKPGQTVGYGAQYVCNQDMKVGIVAFGYGDGYPITARSGAPVLVGRRRCPLVGRISMDMMAVDITECPDVGVGDQVILWGEGLPIEEVVQHAAGITWSVLTGVQHRVKFLWTSD